MTYAHRDMRAAHATLPGALAHTTAQYRESCLLTLSLGHCGLLLWNYSRPNHFTRNEVEITQADLACYRRPKIDTTVIYEGRLH